MSDQQQQFASTIRAAAAARRGLCIRGAGSKDFYGQPRPLELALLDTRGHAGIVDYEPTELVVTARCGTPLAELEALLERHGQMLAFEPPHFGDATVGGMVAAGLSGPRRASAGAVRDFVLGAKLLDGRGEALSFGGRVMKNVAGYDLSRAMAGSLGTLGVILEVSLKTLPRPQSEMTLRLEMPEDKAVESLNRWAGRPLPLTASLWTGDSAPEGRGGGLLHLRLSGAAAGIAEAVEKLGGERLADAHAQAMWRDLREQRLGFFMRAAASDTPLWRVSLPSAAPGAALHAAAGGERLLEWGGALRWLASRSEPARIRNAAAQLGGQATLFRAGDELRRAAGVFHPLPPVLARIHRDLKAAFDPQAVFNPGRLYTDL